MSRSPKTAVPRSIRRDRHTSTRWKRSASRTVGTWVTVSTRALWLIAARAGAVDTRRSTNSFEFELQGVRCKDGGFAALVQNLVPRVARSRSGRLGHLFS